MSKKRTEKPANFKEPKSQCANNVVLDTNFFGNLNSASPVNAEVIRIKNVLQHDSCKTTILIHHQQYHKELSPLMKTHSKVSNRATIISTFLQSLGQRGRLKKLEEDERHQAKVITDFLNSEKNPEVQKEVAKDRFLFDLALLQDCVIVTLEKNVFKLFRGSNNFPKKNKKILQLKLLWLEQTPGTHRITGPKSSESLNFDKEFQAICDMLKSPWKDN